MNSKTLRGLDAVAYVNGNVYSVVTELTWQVSTNSKAIYGLDQLTPFEIFSQRSAISGSMRVFRTRQDGGAEGWGMTPTEHNLSNERYFYLQILDRGALYSPILEIPKCKLTSQSWRAVSRGIIEGTITFEGVEWFNEAG